ncbi:hypothetical protein AX774_g7407 [Zancudomyces culisetae]|uniref:Uncharacterized protein n=1 Tax=Zancudomyces culisetae TaxID=1213189 RepID=A0A1R1PDW7_ZANCU|nr:hypothetical protein AX774_g7407 [Zancudomyces culisetae]|eukprot:OMH79190.1 hypothetical protein AX774_g7407 [Zancudomyces culisetae]
MTNQMEEKFVEKESKNSDGNKDSYIESKVDFLRKKYRSDLLSTAMLLVNNDYYNRQKQLAVESYVENQLKVWNVDWGLVALYFYVLSRKTNYKTTSMALRELVFHLYDSKNGIKEEIKNLIYYYRRFVKADMHAPGEHSDKKVDFDDVGDILKYLLLFFSERGSITQLKEMYDVIFDYCSNHVPDFIPKMNLLVITHAKKNNVHASVDVLYLAMHILRVNEREIPPARRGSAYITSLYLMLQELDTYPFIRDILANEFVRRKEYNLPLALKPKIVDTRSVDHAYMMHLLKSTDVYSLVFARTGRQYFAESLSGDANAFICLFDTYCRQKRVDICIYLLKMLTLYFANHCRLVDPFLFNALCEKLLILKETSGEAKLRMFKQLQKLSGFMNQASSSIISGKRESTVYYELDQKTITTYIKELLFYRFNIYYVVHQALFVFPREFTGYKPNNKVFIILANKIIQIMESGLKNAINENHDYSVAYNRSSYGRGNHTGYVTDIAENNEYRLLLQYMVDHFSRNGYLAKNNELKANLHHKAKELLDF